MGDDIVTGEQILAELHNLEKEQWPEVLKFIDYLKYRERRFQARESTPVLTARDLLASDLVGLWADRTDIGDSLAFARRLRQRAEHRRMKNDDSP